MQEAVLLDVLKVFGLSTISFFVAFLATPLLTYYLYAHKLWRPEIARKAATGEQATVISGILKARTRAETPRMGGILIWGTVVFITLILWVLHILFDSALFLKLSFLSRNQTWLPLAALLAGSFTGLLDDWMAVRGRDTYIGGGLDLKARVAAVLIIGAVGAWWFYSQLEMRGIYIPFWGDVTLGILFVPFFMLTMLAVFAGGVIDGLDGLAGGVFASILAAYGGIAFFQQQLDLATFLGVTIGALLAFLWYNIPPARFYMGETGMLGLTSMLTVIAFLTGAVAVLPIIAFPLVAEVTSNIIQIASKHYRGKKVFLAAPIHHHFEALGWPHFKVTMRFWIVGVVCAIMGMVIHIIGK